MLKSFTVKNAFSFADENTLDMCANKKIKAHRYSLRTSENNKNLPAGMELLPVMSIYGANASGKSNLVRSLKFMFASIVSNECNVMFPFLMADIADNDELGDPICTVIFELDKVEYRLTVKSSFAEYFFEQIEFRENAIGRYRLLYWREWQEDKKVWNKRIGSSVDKSLLDEIAYVSKMEKENRTLLLRALCRRGQTPLFKAIFQWASLFDFAHSIPEHSVNAADFYLNKNSEAMIFFEEPKNKEAVIRFLQLLNPLIDNYEFLEVDSSIEKNSLKLLNFKYSLSSQNTYKYLSAHESNGVRSAFVLLPTISTALKSGGVIVVDELERSLHPLLMAKVVNMFTDPDINVGGGQLIFTTHNVLMMDKKYLRQDEICFVEKDEEGKSEFYKLSDIEGIRSDLDFCKNYILGAFGAIPQFE